MATVVVNLEQGKPRVDAAMTKLKLELSTLRRIGVKTVKIIHGYGSTGTGGAIRDAVRQFLCDQMNNHRIRFFCPGECFGPFENMGRQLVEKMPALHQDPDWGRQNEGITMVILRSK